MNQAMIVCVSLVLAVEAADASSAEAWLTVRTTDGRTLRAQLDADTSETTLWLRATAPGVLLRSQLNWDQVVEVRQGGRRVTADALKHAAQQLTHPAAIPPARTHLVVEPHRPDPRVFQVRVHVRPAEWDDDGQIDGYELAVMPLDQAGELVPVTASLSVRLLGARSLQADEEKDPFPELRRWSLRVRPTDFMPHGAVYRLPFGGFNPELDADLTPEARLSIRLGVTGSGNFVIQRPTRLWPYSRLSDRLRQELGSARHPGDF